MFMSQIGTLTDNTPLVGDHVSRSPRWNMESRQARFALLLLLPSAVMIVLFIGYPLVYSFLLTFSEFSTKEVKLFSAGLSHYETVLTSRDFRQALNFTMIYTAIYVPVSVMLGLLVGVLLQQIKVGAVFFRSLLFLPTVVPITMGLLMFQWILDPANGILNYVLTYVLNTPELARDWLTSRQTVVGTLVAVTMWGFGPWILLLAGLLAIPKDYYEAARVDGATPLQEFLYITIPQMRNPLMVVTTLQVIRSLKVFVPIYVLTQGNPAGTTQSLYYLVFNEINQFHLAEATTVGWVFTAIVLVFSILTTLLFRVRRDE
jgi:multiple sugar transport system permease protein